MGSRRARYVATSVTAAVTVGTVVSMAAAGSADHEDDTGRVAGALASAVGEVALAEMTAAEPVEAQVDEPLVRVPPRVRVRVS